MTRVIEGGGYDGTHDIIRTIKGISDQVTQLGQTSNDGVITNDDGSTITIGNNLTYYQMNVIVSDTQPTTLNSSTDVGTIWYNTGVTPTVIKWWDGFGFQSYTPGQEYFGGIGLEALGPAVVSRVQTSLRIYYQAAAPGSPVVNWLWKNNSTNVLQRYNGTAWVTVADTNIQSAVTYALTATGVDLTDNFLTVNYKATTPAAGDEGDLWYKTDEDYKAFTWDGSAWVDYSGDLRFEAPPSTTDGSPPPYSPVPSVLAGFGTYFVTWDEVPNADATMYDVYASTSSPVVANAGNLLGSTAGTFFFTNMTPAGVAYADGATWYFAVMARDPDGLAPLSASVSGGVIKSKIVRTQITDNAIDTPQLNANAVTAGIVASNAVYTLALQADSVKATAIDATGAITSKHTLTGPTVQTAAGGQRVVVRNDGSGGILEFFAGVVGETPSIIDPDLNGIGNPGINIASGVATGTERASIFLGTGSSGNSTIDFTASNFNFGTPVGNAAFNIMQSTIYIEGTTLSIGKGDAWGQQSTNVYIGGSSTTVTIDGSIAGMGRVTYGWDYGVKSGTPNASGDIVVNHNCGITPASVVITGTSGTGRTYTIVGTTSTTFTVRCWTNAGTAVTSAVDFCWWALA